MDCFSELLNSYWSEIDTVRKTIHENPELAYEEYETAKAIKKVLINHNIDYIDNLYGTGLVGIVKGTISGPTVAIRCELDALPIQEKTGVSFSSRKSNTMHACGHDAHIAMVLGAAAVISRIKERLEGTAKFIFQPAEEQLILGGAKPLIKAGVLNNPDVDAIFGLHVWPEIPKGKFGVTHDEMMASCDTWNLKLIGQAGHISSPHKAKNPIFLAAQIINAIAGIKTQKIDPSEKVVFEASSIHAGSSNNIIPDVLTIKGCTRVYNDILREKIKSDFFSILDGFRKAFNIDYELEYNFGYSPVINDKKMVNLLAEAAGIVLGDNNIIPIKPVMTSEDFGEYLKKVPGALGWLGVGGDKYIPLHNPYFIVDEDIIKKGIMIYCNLIWRFCNLKHAESENKLKQFEVEKVEM